MGTLKLLGLMAALAACIVYLWLVDDEAFDRSERKELENNNHYE